MTIDPRMEARRQNVAESRARIDLRRFLWLVVGAALIVGMGWFLTSPMLSVRTIQVFGAVNADTSEILMEQRVVDGRPLVAIRPGRVVDALEAHPWIRFASVEVFFPDRVDINIEERVGVAWVTVGDKWGLVADDGVLLEYGGRPVGGPIVELAAGDPGLGVVFDDLSVIGALDFIETLPSELAAVTSINFQDGELWATIGDRQVRLGRAIEMSEKAAAVAAIMDSSVDGVIDIIAPTRPAIWAPGPPETTEEGDPIGEAQGSSTEGG